MFFLLRFYFCCPTTINLSYLSRIKQSYRKTVWTEDKWIFVIYWDKVEEHRIVAAPLVETHKRAQSCRGNTTISHLFSAFRIQYANEIYVIDVFT